MEWKQFFKPTPLKIVLTIVLGIAAWFVAYSYSWAEAGGRVPVLLKYFAYILFWPAGILRSIFTYIYSTGIIPLILIAYLYLLICLIIYGFKQNKKILFVLIAILIIYSIFFSVIHYKEAVIQYREARGESYLERAVAEQNEAFCEKATNNEGECYFRISLAKQDSGPCHKIKSEEMRYSKCKCFTTIAVLKQNKSICDEIDDQNNKDTCYTNVVKKIRITSC